MDPHDIINRVSTNGVGTIELNIHLGKRKRKETQPDPHILYHKQNSTKTGSWF